MVDEKEKGYEVVNVEQTRRLDKANQPEVIFRVYADTSKGYRIWVDVTEEEFDAGKADAKLAARAKKADGL